MDQSLCRRRKRHSTERERNRKRTHQIRLPLLPPILLKHPTLNLRLSRSFSRFQKPPPPIPRALQTFLRELQYRSWREEKAESVGKVVVTGRGRGGYFPESRVLRGGVRSEGQTGVAGQGKKRKLVRRGGEKREKQSSTEKGWQRRNHPSWCCSDTRRPVAAVGREVSGSCES